MDLLVSGGYTRLPKTRTKETNHGQSDSGNTEDGVPTVVVGNNFEEIKITYTEYDDAGIVGVSVSYEYDAREIVGVSVSYEYDARDRIVAR